MPILRRRENMKILAHFLNKFYLEIIYVDENKSKRLKEFELLSEFKIHFKILKSLACSVGPWEVTKARKWSLILS